MKPEKLLTRDQFRESVLERDGHRCINCGATGVPLDVHHIVERRCFADGGYYKSNGSTLCDPTCHMLAESTELSCDRIRELCGITNVILPGHAYADTSYDKWLNEILPNGMRLRGELFFDESVHRVLTPVLDRFTRFVKPPRTWHLPWSPGATSDDRIMPDVKAFSGMDVVVTVKLDGENTSVYGPDGYVHARRVEPLASHPSRDRVKALAPVLGPDIPEDWRVCGENVSTKHSIHYENLPPHERWFFMLFNVWNDRNECLAWDSVCEWAELLDLPTVPVLYRGPWNEAAIKALWRDEYDGDPMEGYVVRPVSGFALRDYRKLVGKYVRAHHNQSTHGWRYEIPVFNRTTR